jgi:hypothetical protein
MIRAAAIIRQDALCIRNADFLGFSISEFIVIMLRLEFVLFISFCEVQICILGSLLRKQIFMTPVTPIALCDLHFEHAII